MSTFRNALTTPLFFAIILLSGCDTAGGPRLAHFSSKRGFLYDMSARENAVLYLDKHAVFPVCRDDGNFPAFCPAQKASRWYFNPNQITWLRPYPALPRWAIRYSELRSDAVEITLVAPPDALVEPELHPAAWVEFPDDATTAIHLSPVYPQVVLDRVATELDPALVPKIRAVSDSEVEVILRRKLPLAYSLKWAGGTSLVIRFKDYLPAEKVVVIDPGHGGREDGACPEKKCEKDIALEAATLLKQMIEGPSVKVLLTRAADQSISLEDRVKFAEDSKADLFLSLHVDNWEDGGQLIPPTGVSCYYFQPGSAALAASICAPAPDDAHRSAAWITKRGLYVLHSTEYPSVLLELGNLRDPADRDVLLDSARLAELVRSLAARIRKVLE